MDRATHSVVWVKAWKPTAIGLIGDPAFALVAVEDGDRMVIKGTVSPGTDGAGRVFTGEGVVVRCDAPREPLLSDAATSWELDAYEWGTLLLQTQSTLDRMKDDVLGIPAPKLRFMGVSAEEAGFPYSASSRSWVIEETLQEGNA